MDEPKDDCTLLKSKITLSNDTDNHLSQRFASSHCDALNLKPYTTYILYLIPR